ncbi:MFS transporter [Clostridiaceae bacterium M8S5]|nr:MFS transporter [Clostridiaceae bacterium M8S5]
MQKRLTLKEKLTYSLGNLGVGIIMTLHMWYLVYFFFPPCDSGIKYTIPQNAVFLGVTILGLIMATGRIFDAITDPIIANRSDNKKHKLGKRIPFMRRYGFAMAASYVLIFIVPIPNEIHIYNVLWLAIFMFLSALFFTLYTVPYYSLLVHIGKHPDDKIDLATFNSVFWFSGLLLTSFAAGSWEMIYNWLGVSMQSAIQISFVVLGVFGFIFLMIPAYLLDENKYGKQVVHVDNYRFKDSMKQVLKNKNFVRFLFANASYTLATYMYETGLLYFITVLALKDKSLQGILAIVIGLATLATYPIVNKFAKKKGKKILMSLGFVLFAVSFIDITLFGLFGINVNILIVLLVIITPLPQAIFGILPHAMVADCAAYDQHINGKDQSGMYMAVNGFFTKIGTSIATILFTSLLVFGKDPGNDLGIRMITIAGAVLSIVSVGLISKYNEKEIMSYASKERAKSIE